MVIDEESLVTTNERNRIILALLNRTNLWIDLTTVRALIVLSINCISIYWWHHIVVIVTSTTLLRYIKSWWISIFWCYDVFTLYCSSKRSSSCVYNSSAFAIRTLRSIVILINVDIALNNKTFLRLLRISKSLNICIILNLLNCVTVCQIWIYSLWNYTIWVILERRIVVYCICCCTALRLFLRQYNLTLKNIIQWQLTPELSLFNILNHYGVSLSIHNTFIESLNNITRVKSILIACNIRFFNCNSTTTAICNLYLYNIIITFLFVVSGVFGNQ